MSTQTRRPAVLENTDTLGPLDTPPAVQIPAAKIREGMVLLDPELGTPVYWIDNKLRGSHGSVLFNVWNLETGRFETGFRIRATATIPVVAAS